MSRTQTDSRRRIQTDSTREGITPSSAPDGGKSRAAYNVEHGRKANAPTSGGPRQAAYDALLSNEKRIPAAYRRKEST